MKREVSWPVVLVVVAAVAVTAFSAYLLAAWPPDPPPAPAGQEDQAAAGSRSPSPSSSPARSAQPSTRPAAVAKHMVVLGDSVSARSDESAGPEWPTLLAESLGWDVTIDAAAGSGYVSAGQGRPFGARVPAVLGRSPDVIVVAGGLGDLGAHPMQRITSAADDVVTRLAQQAPEAEIVVLSPFSPGNPGPLTEQFSGNLRRIAQEQGVTYVDATRWLTRGQRLFGADPNHPTDLGQGRIAERLEEALVERGIASPQSGDL